MPPIVRVISNNCDYNVLGITSRTSVILDDGSELVCPHPSEWRTAEASTGKSWAELSKANRLVCRYAPLSPHKEVSHDVRHP